MSILQSLGFGAPQPDPMQAQQMQQPPMPQQQAPQPGLGSRINQGIADNSGMMMALGGQLLAHRHNAANAPFDAQALMVGQQMDSKRKKEREEKEKERRGRQAAIQSLIELNIAPNEQVAGQLVDVHPDLAAKALERQHLPEQQKPTADIQNYKFYANEELKAGRQPMPFGEWSQSAGSGAGEFGLTPQYGVDADGNPVILQLNKGSPHAAQVQMPEGVQLSKEPIKMDAGTHFVLLDPITRQPVGQITKDIEGEEAAKVRGKGMGEAQMELGGTLAKTQLSIDTLDKIIKHPGRETATGMSGLIDPRNYIPGTDARNFHVLRNQAVGQVYLEAYQELKGGGHITEFEGKKAEQAKARLDTDQGDAEFLAAVQELREVLVAGAERARQKAGMPGQQAPQQQQQRIRLDANGNIIQ